MLRCGDGSEVRGRDENADTSQMNVRNVVGHGRRAKVVRSRVTVMRRENPADVERHASGRFIIPDSNRQTGLTT